LERGIDNIGLLLAKYALITQLMAQADAMSAAPYEMPVVLAPEPKAEKLTVEATAYVSDCEGCIGITRSGVDVRHTTTHKGRTVIAVDPAVIALGTAVDIRLDSGRTIEAIAEDVGGAIKGARIDVLMANESAALEFGRQDVEITILEEESE
jgi:3D (Asp-Asp-Asp) domain-containing protein